MILWFQATATEHICSAAFMFSHRQLPSCEQYIPVIVCKCFNSPALYWWDSNLMLCISSNLAGHTSSALVWNFNFKCIHVWCEVRSFHVFIDAVLFYHTGFVSFYISIRLVFILFCIPSNTLFFMFIHFPFTLYACISFYIVLCFDIKYWLS